MCVLNILWRVWISSILPQSSLLVELISLFLKLLNDLTVQVFMKMLLQVLLISLLFFLFQIAEVPINRRAYFMMLWAITWKTLLLFCGNTKRLMEILFGMKSIFKNFSLFLRMIRQVFFQMSHCSFQNFVIINLSFEFWMLIFNNLCLNFCCNWATWLFSMDNRSILGHCYLLSRFFLLNLLHSWDILFHFVFSFQILSCFNISVVSKMFDLSRLLSFIRMRHIHLVLLYRFKHLLFEKLVFFCGLY